MANQTEASTSEYYGSPFEISDPSFHAYLAMRCANMLAECCADALLKAEGLRPGYYGILLALHGGRQMTLRDLSKWIFRGRTNMSAFITRMVNDGLLRRDPDPTDHRRILVRLTDEGESVYQRISPAHAERLRGAMAALTDDQIAQFTDLVCLVVKGILLTSQDLGVTMPDWPRLKDIPRMDH